jgi:hypothetical protein
MKNDDCNHGGMLVFGIVYFSLLGAFLATIWIVGRIILPALIYMGWGVYKIWGGFIAPRNVFTGKAAIDELNRIQADLARRRR